MDLDALKSSQAIKVADLCEQAQYGMWQERLSQGMDSPFGHVTSPAFTFGLPLITSVWLTLESWAVQRPTKENLQWARPVFTRRMRETMAVYLATAEEYRYTARDFFRNPMVRMLGPVAFEFKTIGWDIFGGESRANAKEAIMGALEAQVEQKLNEVAHIVATEPHLETMPEIHEPEHFHWLVLYQLFEGTTFADVTRKVKKLPQGATDKLRSAKVTITKGIKNAAERLIGPRVDDWLRPGLPGRPPGQ
jgi:hypothetical protein